jgi:hypothetical protein
MGLLFGCRRMAHLRPAAQVSYWIGVKAIES